MSRKAKRRKEPPNCRCSIAPLGTALGRVLFRDYENEARYGYLVGLGHQIGQADREEAMRDLMRAERDVISEAQAWRSGDGSEMRLANAVAALNHVRSRHESHGR